MTCKCTIVFEDNSFVVDNLLSVHLLPKLPVSCFILTTATMYIINTDTRLRTALCLRIGAQLHHLCLNMICLFVKTILRLIKSLIRIVVARRWSLYSCPLDKALCMILLAKQALYTRQFPNVNDLSLLLNFSGT